MIPRDPGITRAGCLHARANEENLSCSMTDSHRLHEARIEGRGVDPAGAFSVEAVPAPDGVVIVVLEGELDMAATASLRGYVDGAAGKRGVVLDLTDVTFVDSAILKELLRASAELDRYSTRLVLAGMPGQVQRLLDLTRTTELFTLAPDREAALRLVER
jgi:anti-anti-sigma factor